MTTGERTKKGSIRGEEKKGVGRVEGEGDVEKVSSLLA